VQILRTEDRRSNLERARRSELVKFAKENGISEIIPEMPATLMRKILQSRGLTNIQVAPSRLGDIPRKNLNQRVQLKSSVRHGIPEPHGVEVDADVDLMRQWQASQAAKSNDRDNVKPVNADSVSVVEHRPFRNPDNPTMAELKKEAKRRGLKPPRTMKMPELKQLLGV
jgi:hypothetical protein